MKECLGCGERLYTAFRVSDLFSFSRLPEEVRCQKCTKKLIPIPERKACRGCCRLQEDRELCQDCVRWQKEYPGSSFSHRALYAYEGWITEWLEHYKYKGDYRQAAFFKEDISEAVRSFERAIVVPIPVSQASMASRGFNQVEGLLKAANVPYLSALQHRGRGEKQSKKNRQERMTSPQPFAIKEENRDKIANQKILLVDDVYTTGRTLFHARDLLLQQGGGEVHTFTLSR